MGKKSRRPNRRNRHDRERPPVPPWQVILVGQHVGQHCTSPNCTHHDEKLPPGVEPFADFAYTVGLYDLFGLPEVHLPAYPDGDGKPLPPSALGGVVNGLASWLVTGRLAAGGEQRIPLCEHLTAVLTLGEPGPLAAVSAFQCTDGAECIPARWRVEGVHEPSAA